MAEQFGIPLEQKFKTPEEELAFLRDKVAEHEKNLTEKGEIPNKEKIISAEIQEHGKKNPAEILHPDYSLKKKETEAIVLDLKPEEHDAKMSELVGILIDKGILNTMKIVENLKDPHIDDDFHRFLVQYIKAGFLSPKEKAPILKALKMTLYEISLPGLADEQQKTKGLKELISKMEQFYSGMMSISSDDKDGAGYYCLELSNKIGSKEIVFYLCVPDSKKSLFVKQLQSIFPEAELKEKKDDYNIFFEGGDFVGSVAELSEHHIFPLKTYEQFDYDPLNVILNAFSKIQEGTEGASVQIIVRPTKDDRVMQYKNILKEMEKGAKFKDALTKADSSFGNIFKQIGKEFFLPEKKKDEKKDQAPNQLQIENIRAKLTSPVISTNVRILTSSQTREQAFSILTEIESAFNQFENTNGNAFKFKRCEGKDLLRLAQDYSFRLFKEEEKIHMNLKELTTIMHMPEVNFSKTAGLKLTKANTAPAPLDLPNVGILLGDNKYRDISTPIHMSPEDRLRHMYVIGQTGTGKTTLLKTMIRQDILAGEGVCMIDPHGSDIQEILSYVPPERYDDLIYFDPSYTDRPMGLNMLEYDERFPDQKTFVVNEMLSIFNKLFDMKVAGGPAFEQYFRNSALLVMEDPASGNTLLDIARVLSDKTYRDMKLSKCKNPLINQFWANAVKTTGDQGLANYVPYITNKFDVFLSNEIMRPIVSQEKSAFDFRDIMDNKKILLVNLAKGKLGDINSNLIGLIIVGKLLMAALSRTDSFGKDFPPFYLYIDEFQNVTTDSISTILSEARKYKLSLTVAHQFIAQLDEKIKNSVFGNVGSMAVFRVSSDDAEFLSKQFVPVFTPNDLMNIDNHNSYVKMLSNGRPVKPFSMATNLPPRGQKAVLDKIKEISYLKYGVDRKTVEDLILDKYKKPEPIIAPQPDGLKVYTEKKPADQI